MNTEAVSLLKAWATDEDQDDDLVFPGRTGDILDSINKGWHTLMTSAKITGFRFHDLRPRLATIKAYRKPFKISHREAAEHEEGTDAQEADAEEIATQEIRTARRSSDKSDLTDIGHDVLERHSRELTPIQVKGLGHLAKLREFSNEANALRMCEIAYALARGAPDKTVPALHRLFNSTPGIPYKRGKERALAFKSYRRDPTEFFRYKPTAAMLLANKPPCERRRLWANSGNLPKLRALLRDNPASTSSRPTPAAQASPEPQDTGAPDVAPTATELD